MSAARSCVRARVGDGESSEIGQAAAPAEGNGKSHEANPLHVGGSASVPPNQGKGGEARTWPGIGDFSAEGILLGGGQGLVQGGNRAKRWGAESLAEGQRLLDRSRELFTKYLKHFVIEWAFYKSPVNGGNGATGPLSEFLTAKGIKHNADNLRWGLW